MVRLTVGILIAAYFVLPVMFFGSIYLVAVDVKAELPKLVILTGVQIVYVAILMFVTNKYRRMLWKHAEDKEE